MAVHLVICVWCLCVCACVCIYLCVRGSDSVCICRERQTLLCFICIVRGAVSGFVAASFSPLCLLFSHSLSYLLEPRRFVYTPGFYPRKLFTLFSGFYYAKQQIFQFPLNPQLNQSLLSGCFPVLKGCQLPYLHSFSLPLSFFCIYHLDNCSSLILFNYF